MRAFQYVDVPILGVGFIDQISSYLFTHPADADRTREQIAINRRLHISVGAGRVIYDASRINRAVCKHQHPPSPPLALVTADHGQ